MHLFLPICVPASILLVFWANVIWTSIDQYLNPTSGVAVDVSPDPGFAEDVIATSVAVACGWFTFLVVRRFWGSVDRSAPCLAGVCRSRRFLGYAGRSAESRGGKACVGTCGPRWSRYHDEK